MLSALAELLQMPFKKEERKAKGRLKAYYKFKIFGEGDYNKGYITCLDYGCTDYEGATRILLLKVQESFIEQNVPVTSVEFISQAEYESIAY